VIPYGTSSRSGYFTLLYTVLSIVRADEDFLFPRQNLVINPAAGFVRTAVNFPTSEHHHL